LRDTCYVMPISEEVDVLPNIYSSGDFRKLDIGEAFVKVSDFKND